MKICPSTVLLATLLAVTLTVPDAVALDANHPSLKRFFFPQGYLNEPETIPAFWLSSVEEVETFLSTQVKKGAVEVIGHTAGGRPIRAVGYGTPRRAGGTSTFSGSLGYGDSRVYRGPDHEKKVVLIMAAVHGGEFESIVGCVNLLAVLETGRDLRGVERPDIVAAAQSVDRVIVVPIVNVDGRARIPIRMERHSANGYLVHEYLNTGGNRDGKTIGWPQIKEFIPLDFEKVGFPGGYPNDHGVNIQHDDFFGHPQPETRALFDLTAREKPDLILNLHTGAPMEDYFVRTHRHPMEPLLESVFVEFNRHTRAALARAGLQSTRDAQVEGDPKLVSVGTYNLNTALNFHCGAMSVVIESPSHAYSAMRRGGTELVRHSPEMLIDAQLILHRSAMEFVAATGGRAKWAAKK